MSDSCLRGPIAVVGVSCRLPGAHDLEGFWNLLKEGRSAVVEMPAHRLDRDLYFDGRRGQRGKTYSTIGGLVTEQPPRSGDAEYDVCHRIFADVAVEACRNAGLSRDELTGHSVGVFVGHSGGSPEFGDVTLGTMAVQVYEPLRDLPAVQALGAARADALIDGAAARLRRDKPQRGAGGTPRGESRWAAELVAKTLGLTGPNLVVDAACSSSLVALALGALALERGEVDVAIIGGASYAQTNSLILFSQAQSCSATGSRPFDARADGLVGSEGYVAMVLKTEEQARRDGDQILAVIRGIGVSTDGRGRHLWAPRKEGQTAAMQRAYGSAIDPAGVQYVEAHATSTQVGDATEIESMAEFFGHHLNGAKVPIGSVKSNIGHTLETAGLASLLKVILAMKHEAIPPTVNIDKLNESIAWTAIPFEVARSLRPWARPQGDVRRAAVSAFGIGGLNVHLIVEEAGEQPQAAAPPAEPSREPIAIVGRGVVVPGARDVRGFENFLKLGNPALSEAPESRWPGRAGVDANGASWCAPTSRGGFIQNYEYDSLGHRVPPKQVAAANPLQFMLLDATEQALGEAGTVDRARTAVVVGTAFGSEFGNQLLLGLRFPEIRRSLDEVLRDQGYTDAERRSVEQAYEQVFFDVFPAVNDVTGSFTSSTLASRITKTFDLEGGAMAIDAGDASSFVALSNACTLLRGNVCSAVVCAGAQRALDLPSFETMAHRGRLTGPDDLLGEGVGVVLLKRLSDARRDGNPILGVVFGHEIRYGAAEPATIAETRAPSLASLIGDLGPAAGMVSLIRATVQPRPGVEVLSAASDSGLTCEVTLGPPPPARTPAGTGFRVNVGAPTLAALRERLIYTSADAETPFSSDDRFRLAVVSPDPAEMPGRLALAESLLGSERARTLLEEQGIFLGQAGPVRPRVAFVFAGQGSQYAGMLQELVEHSPAARRALADADRHLTAAGLGTFAELAWGNKARLDEDPVTTQIAVLVADTIMFASVLESGIEPDCVCGHSFGEISAMVAARVFTLEQAIRVTIERARALAGANPDGGLLSVQASLREVKDLIAAQSRTLYVTHHNAPTQTVVGGRQSDLAEFAGALRAEGYKTTTLRVPGALHSPLVAGAQAPLRAALERETLRPPTRLFYSNVTCGHVARAEEFVDNLVAQLAEPLDYPRLVKRLVADGVGALVEIGPSQVLTRLHRQIVGWEVVCTGTDHPRRGAWEQLERARAALECVGAVEPRAGAPVAMHAAPATIVEFDATTVRRERRRAEAAAAAAGAARPERVEVPDAPAAAKAAPALAADAALANMLLDFVVDLTGYPRDAISLDWDLEADLGLDSIKRTQLVGEMAEALALETIADDAAALAGLSTLRELLAYFQRAATPAELPEQRRPEQLAYQSGFDQGRRHEAAIRSLLRNEALSLNGTTRIRPAAESRAELSARELSELQGLADGSGVHVGNVVAYRLRRGVAPLPGANRVAPSNGSDAAAGPPPSHRYVMRMMELSHPADVAGRRLTGAALVVGDTPLARRLRERLETLGVVVHALAPGGTARAAVDELNRQWEEGPVPHLFFATGHDRHAVRELDTDAWALRRESALMVPFSLCQRWVALVERDGLMDDASLVALTDLGGDLGLSGQAESFESGALPGLFKAIAMESWVADHRHLAVKIVDAPRHEPADAIVDAALRELAVPSFESEIGIRGGVRRVVRPVHAELPAADGLLNMGSTWICTGGARGITAYVAKELGRRFGLKLHLLGRAARAELPESWRALWPERRRELKVRVMDAARHAGDNPVKAWENALKVLEIEDTLNELASLGVEATYHSCEISDREALDRVLARVRAQGPIHGILHGAGYSRDAKFEQKEADRVDQCFRAKVDGTLALMEATRDDPLKYFLAFGSVSGRFGANGHADYSAANDMMAKLVDWYRGKRPDVAAVTFHWHAWGDVGMATKAGTQLGLQMVDMDFMPAPEGVEHIVRELRAGAPEAEVLITQEQYLARYYTAETIATGAGADTRAAARRPLLGGAPCEERHGTRIFTCALDPDREVFLREHLFDGRPLLPLVATLELAAEAALPTQPTPFVMGPVKICNGLRFPETEPQTVRVLVTGTDNGAARCEVVSDFRARDGTLLEADRPIVRTSIAALEGAGARAGELDASAVRGEWRALTYDDATSRFYHGPAFQCLRRYRLTEQGLEGQISASAIGELGGAGRPSEGWRLHLGVLDACLYAAACLALTIQPWHSIPAGIDELFVGRFPRAREDCVVQVVPGEQTDEMGRFDFRLHGANGETLMDAKGYQIARVAAKELVLR